MTDNKTDVPCPTRTLAVRSDGTIVRGLAATGTEARRWLEAVQTHGRRTALAQVALAATTPATPGEGHKGTTVSARNWRVVTDWTTPGAETCDNEGFIVRCITDLHERRDRARASGLCSCGAERAPGYRLCPSGAP